MGKLEGSDVSHIFGPGKVHDFVEGPPAVILADGVSFFVADMIVCCNQNADCVRVWSRENVSRGVVSLELDEGGRERVKQYL